MRAFNCDKCKETYQGHPVVYDICMDCMPAVRASLDAADESEPEREPPSLAALLRELADEMERKGVATYVVTEEHKQVDTTRGMGFPRTFMPSAGQRVIISWDWKPTKEN